MAAAAAAGQPLTFACEPAAAVVPECLGGAASRSAQAAARISLLRACWRRRKRRELHPRVASACSCFFLLVCGQLLGALRLLANSCAHHERKQLCSLAHSVIASARAVRYARARLLDSPLYAAEHASQPASKAAGLRILASRAKPIASASLTRYQPTIVSCTFRSHSLAAVRSQRLASGGGGQRPMCASCAYATPTQLQA